jgi:hypothetical protein
MPFNTRTRSARPWAGGGDDAEEERARRGLEIYSRIALADAQKSYDRAISRFPV